MVLLYDKNGRIDGHMCKCGKEHKWPGYVYAHYDIELFFKCDECNLEITLQNGVANEVTK